MITQRKNLHTFTKEKEIKHVIAKTANPKKTVREEERKYLQNRHCRKSLSINNHFKCKKIKIL
jgi:hypothetical protein